MPDERRVDLSQEELAILIAERLQLKHVGGQKRSGTTVASLTAWRTLGRRRFRRVMNTDVEDSDVAIGILAQPGPADIREHVQNYEEGDRR